MNQVVIILAVLSIAAIILAVSQGAFNNDPSDQAPPAPVLLPDER
jgi:uncharacterized protein YdeI (BOF family)